MLGYREWRLITVTRASFGRRQLLHRMAIRTEQNRTPLPSIQGGLGGGTRRQVVNIIVIIKIIHSLVCKLIASVKHCICGLAPLGWLVAQLHSQQDILRRRRRRRGRMFLTCAAAQINSRFRVLHYDLICEYQAIDSPRSVHVLSQSVRGKHCMYGMAHYSPFRPQRSIWDSQV